MKSIFIGLVGIIPYLSGSTAIADVLKAEDDTYIGFQVTIPVAVNRSKLISGRKEYSALFISQHDGIRDGFVFTRNSDGDRTIGYLKPSRTYRIAGSQVADYTLPIVTLTEGNEIRNNFGAVEGVAVVAIAIVAAGKFMQEVIDETTDCVDPDVESEHIAGC